MLRKPYTKLFSIILAAVLLCGSFTEAFAYSGAPYRAAEQEAVTEWPGPDEGEWGNLGALAFQMYQQGDHLAAAMRLLRTENEPREAEGPEEEAELPDGAWIYETEMLEETYIEYGEKAIPSVAYPVQQEPYRQYVDIIDYTGEGNTIVSEPEMEPEKAGEDEDFDFPVQGLSYEGGTGEAADQQEAAAGEAPELLDEEEPNSADWDMSGSAGGSAAASSANIDSSLSENNNDRFRSEQQTLDSGGKDEGSEDSGETGGSSKDEGEGPGGGLNDGSGSDPSGEDIGTGGGSFGGNQEGLAEDNGQKEPDEKEILPENPDVEEMLAEEPEMQPADALLFSGAGTAESPFLIENEEQLLYIASLSGGSIQGVTAMRAHYRLMADIDLSDASSFYGIGSQAYPFQGVFDGNGYTVTLNIIDSSTSYVGLFGYVSGAAIRNVSVEGAVSGNNYVGGLAGYAEAAVITGSVNSSKVSGKRYIGGIAGYASQSEITDVSNVDMINSTAISSSDYSDTGGIAGYLDNAVIARASNNGVVRGGRELGGIVGGASAAQIISAQNTGAVATYLTSGASAYTGGIAGRIDNGTLIEDCADAGAGITGRSYTGGIAGYVSASTITGSTTSGKLSGNSYTGGIAGYLANGEVAGSTASGSISGAASTGGIVGQVTGNSIIRESAFDGGAVSGTTPGTIAGTSSGSLVLENSGSYIRGKISPADAQIMLDDMPCSEEQIQRGADGDFAVYLPALITQDSSISGNTPESITFLGSGYEIQKVYLSLNNAKASYSLNIGSVTLRESDVEENLQGEGTEESPFLINHGDQLVYVASLLGGSLKGVPAMEGHYQVAADLDLSGASGFYGIGSERIPFKGTFDGDGYEIKLNIAASSENAVGLFRYTSGAEIRNLTTAGTVTGNNYVGSIAGRVENTVIENSVSRSAVNGKQYVGGIAGRAEDSSIAGSTVGGSISGTYYTGGAAGEISGGEVAESSVTGTVEGTYYTGGIAGNAVDGEITDGQVNGTVTGSYNAGGILGRASGNSAIKDSVFNGETVAGMASGIVIGTFSGSLVIENSGYYISGMVSPADAQIFLDNEECDEELIERESDGSFAVYVPVEVSNGNVSRNVPESITFIRSGHRSENRYLSENNAKENFTLQVGSIVLEESDTEENIQGAGTEGSPFLIENEEQLLYVVSLLNRPLKGVPALEAFYKIERDLDLSGKTEFLGIGTENIPFQGIFDGNGHEVKLNISAGQQDYVGFFRRTSEAEIRNVAITGSVTGKNYVGGIAGDIENTTVIEAANHSVVTGGERIGGIAGNASASTISEAFNTGNVSSTLSNTIFSSYTGGIAGELEEGSVIEESYNEADIKGQRYTGGIAGRISYSQVKNSENTGSVTGSLYIGGIAGSIGDGEIESGTVSGTVNGSSYVGGVSGIASDTDIKGSEVSGLVTGGSYTGGVAGYLSNGTIADSIVSGSVSGSSQTGGILGAAAWTTAIENSIFSGEKISGSAPGIIVGAVDTNLTVEASGFYISGMLTPPNAEILLDGRAHDENLIEREEDGSFRVYVPVSKPRGGAISGNVPESVSFLHQGYALEKIYLSENNAKARFTLYVGEIVLEESDIGQDIKGDGTAESPFQIENEEQLLYVVSLQGGMLKGIPAADASYRLMSDLDLSSAEGFYGIGSQNTPFRGDFDGNQNKIQLNISAGSENYAGLFRYTSGASIKDVDIAGTITGADYVGGIAGYTVNTAITNVNVEGTVAGRSYIGGIAGYLDNADVTGAVCRAAVSGSSSNVGGITGYGSGSRITGVRNEGAVTTSMGSTSYSYTGGIAGRIAAGTVIEESVNTGNVTGQRGTGGIAGHSSASAIKMGTVYGLTNGSGYMGGIAGELANGSIEASSVSGSVIGTSAYVGGIAGYASGNAVIDGADFSGEKIAGSAPGMIVGTAAGNVSVSDSGYYIRGKVSPVDAQILLNDQTLDDSFIERLEDGSFTVYVPAAKAAGSPISGNVPESITFSRYGYVTEQVYLSLNNGKASFTLEIGEVTLEEGELESSIKGEGTEASPFLIETEEQFLYMASLAGSTLKDTPAMEAYYHLEADLDLSSASAFNGIGSSRYPFRGSFDGGGYEIRLDINAGAEDYIGLFRYTEDAEIRRITVSGNIAGSAYTGGIAGYASGTRFHDNYIRSMTISSGANVLIGAGENNQFYGNGVIITAETSAATPEITVVGFEDISADEQINIAYEENGFTLFIPVNQQKNNYVVQASIRLSKVQYYDRVFTLKSSGAAYNFVLPSYITFVPIGNVRLDVVTVDSPENAVIDTVQKTVTASVGLDAESVEIILETSEGSTWKLYENQACTDEIADRIMQLEPGTNTAYIEITGSDGVSRQIYTINVFREHGKPLPVNGLAAVSGTETVLLRWEMAYEASVRGYYLYRSVMPESGYMKITDISDRSTLSYTDRTVTAERLYYYKISAYNSAGAESELSEYVTAIAGLDTQPPVVLGISPVNETTIGKNAEITVRAEDNIGLKEIWLEYRLDAEDEWQLIGKKEVTGISGSAVFKLSEISHHGTIWVRAFAGDHKDNVSDGTPVRLYYMDTEGPQKVTGLIGIPMDSAVTLEWNNVPDDDFAYFAVEQKNAEGANFRQIARVTTTLGYHVLDLKPDTGYWFRVRAFDHLDNPGEYSDEIQVFTTGDTTKPQVTAIKPSPGYYAASIPVQITATDNIGVASIEVEISSNGTNWSSAGIKNFETTLKTASASFAVSITGIPEGPVFVRAFAEDGAGNRSNASSMVEHRVDRTPPAQPQGLRVESTAEYILVQWNRGSETDLKAYSVYRAESLNGEYVKIKANLSSLGYCDRDVKFGRTYYYKVTAVDGAGNESGFSSTVSASLTEDDIEPWISGISPGNGIPVGINPTIRVQARDNVDLARITVQYRDRAGWTNIGRENVSGMSARVDFIWENADLPGGEYELRFFAEDAAGNRSDYIEVTYELRNFVIEKPVVTLTPGDMSIHLAWEPVSYADAAGYRVYRVEEDRNVLLEEIVSGKETVYKDERLDPAKTYQYYVEVYDYYGNFSVSDIVSGKPLNNDPYPPEAKAGFNMNTMVGVETAFNGDLSTDNMGIVSWHWNFGDGSTGEGVRTVHVYQEAGTYTVTLTVKDAAGNQDSDSIQVKALLPSQAGSVVVKVVDQDTGEVLSDASVYVDYPEEPLLLRTDANGEVTIAAEPGTYGVSAYKVGYLPKEESIKVEQYADNRATISIPQGELVVGEIWTERLTLEEIGRLGIDTSDPANRHVYNFSVTLVFQQTEFTQEYTVDRNGYFYFGSGNGISIGGGGRFRLPGGGGGGGNGYVYAVPGPTDETPPTLVFLTMNNSVSFMKEFYSVSLVMHNMADPQFVLKDNNFRLNLPRGLSLATTAEGQNRVQTIEEIAGGESSVVTWVIRGDEVGSYDLSVNYSGTLMPFDELVEAVFATDDDLIIGGAEGLVIYVMPYDFGFPGGDYYVVYALRNTSGKTFYDVKTTFGSNLKPAEYSFSLVDDDGNEEVYTISEGNQYALETVELQNGLPVVTNYDTILLRTLGPGETLYGLYETTLPVGEGIEPYYYQLIDSFYETLGGSTVEIPVKFVTSMNFPEGGFWHPGFWLGADSGVNESGYFELEEEVLSVTGINELSFRLRHYSGYKTTKAEEDIFNEHPDDDVWDLPATGWSSNYEMKVVPQPDGAINLYFAPGIGLRFVHSNMRSRVIYGELQAGSVEIRRGNSTGDYYCNEVGYQDYTLKKNSDGTFVLTDAEKIRYYFNESGILTHTENRFGHTIDIKRSSSGENGRTVTVSERGSDQKITAFYDDSGNLTSVKDNLGREAKVDYTKTGEGIKIGSLTTPAGDVISYEYDEYKINKKSINDQTVFTKTYDDEGRVLTKTDGEGNTTTYTYDSESVFWQSTVTTTDSDGRVKTTVSNRLGHVASEKNGLGHTTSHSYNLNGDLTSTRDANGHTTIFDHDDKGNLLSVEDGEGVKESVTYDERSNVLTHTSETGAVTTHIYSDKNWLLKTVDERGVVTEYTYNDYGQVLTETVSGLGTAYYAYENGRLVSETDFLGQTSTNRYDGAGRLIASTDKDGNTTSYEYDAMDRVVMTTDPRGYATRYTYDDRGNVLTITDPRGGVTVNEYDKNDRLVKEVDALGGSTLYEHDGEGNVIQVTAADGKVTYYTYDAAGQKTSVTDPDGGTTVYEYDPAGQLVKTILPNGGVQTTEYDRSGRRIKETDTMGGVTTYQYDEAGQLALETGPTGNAIRYTYDQSGNQLSVRDGEGNTIYFEYDQYGRLVSETDTGGNTTIYEYDALGRQTKIIDALGNVTQNFYNGNDQIVKTIDARGAETLVVYDSAGNIVSTTDPTGNTAYSEFDEAGNMTVMKDAYGRVVMTTEYDLLNRSVAVTDALGNTVRTVYDAVGRTVETISPLSEVTRYAYDGRGNLIVQTEPEGGITRYTYDAMGNMVDMTDPNGGMTRYHYDLEGRLLKEEKANGGIKTYEYDAAGQMTGMTNGRGQVQSFRYDLAGRMTEGSGIQYTYDASGNVRTVTNEVGTTIKLYDAVGRMTSFTDVYGSVIRYFYDETGNLTEIIYPDGKTVRYTYDLAGRMTSVTDYAGRVTSYEYDRNGNLTKTAFANGITEEITYSINGQMKSRISRKDGELISYGEYSHDANGNVVDEKDDAMRSRSIYDKNGQLLSRSDTWYNGRRETYGFAYDDGGNMTREDITGRGTGAVSGRTDMSYSPGNQVETWDGHELRFDPDGNMTWGPLGGVLSTYGYDRLNQLTSAGSTSYTYDGEGTRVRQNSGGRDIRYITSPNASLSQLLVMQEDGISTYYVYGLGLISQERIAADGDSQYRIFHYDYRGNTVAMTDERGIVTDRITYDPYGAITSRTGSTETIFLYSGNWGVQTDDNELLYMRARYYNTDLNRFVNEDPVRDGINWYIYGNNNPLNYIDPQGTIAFLIPVVMGALTLYSAYQTGKALAEGDYKRAAFEAIGLIPVGKVGTLAVKGALKIAPKLVSKGKTLLTAGKNVAKGVVTFAKESGVGKSIASGITKFASGMDKAASAVSDFGRRLFGGKGPSGEPWCFIAGTLILTDEGCDEIQNIEAGDLVLSSNPDTGETAYKEVVNVFVNESWELFHVSAGNEVITTTASHPFWVEDRGFVPAGMLAAGDMLRLSSGTAVAVGSIERELLDEPVTVYNFEVADWHTYFVSEMGVLVHNTCGEVNRNPLIPGEGDIGTYRELIRAGEKLDDLTPHHMPSAEFMRRLGIDKNSSFAMNMQQLIVGGRHRITSTYGRNMTNVEKAYYYSLSPRDALAFDIKDIRRIYKSVGLYKEMLPHIRAYAKMVQRKMPFLFGKGV